MQASIRRTHKSASPPCRRHPNKAADLYHSPKGPPPAALLLLLGTLEPAWRTPAVLEMSVATVQQTGEAGCDIESNALTVESLLSCKDAASCKSKQHIASDCSSALCLPSRHLDTACNSSQRPYTAGPPKQGSCAEGSRTEPERLCEEHLGLKGLNKSQSCCSLPDEADGTAS